MKNKIEASLRRAAEQLPQPDFQAVADTPVRPLEVHDYITRQEPRPRRTFRPAAAVLVLCALALCLGLWAYFQYFQIYSVVDLRVNPAFAIQLDRRDRVRGVQALTEDAGPILEGRSYRGWSLEHTVEALLGDLAAAGYLEEGIQVDVAVNSKDAEHGRALREEVEVLVEQSLSGLSAAGETADPTPAQTPAPTAPQTSDPAPVPTESTGGLLTLEEAQAVVTGRLPGAVFEEVKLDEEDGRLIYELKFWDADGREYEAELDASTGAVLKWEQD